MSSEFAKCPVCGSSGGYEQSGILGNYAKCSACLAKWRLYFENERLSSLSLHELPKNGQGLLKVDGTNAPLFAVIGKPVSVSFWKNMKLVERLDWNMLSALVDLSVADSVMKEKDERVLYRWDGVRLVTTTVVVQGNSVQTGTQLSGALVLTSRRLVWLDMREAGSWWNRVPSFVTTYEIRLEGVKGISGQTGDSSSWFIPKELSIVDANGEHRFALQYAFLELFKPTVENAVEMRNAEIDAEKRRERVHVMLDFSFLKTYMENGGFIMQALKCPECGGSVEFPKNGTETKCSHCGKTIYAQDIFEKLKELI